MASQRVERVRRSFESARSAWAAGEPTPDETCDEIVRRQDFLSAAEARRAAGADDQQ